MSLNNVINEQTQFSDFNSILNNAIEAKQYGVLLSLFNLPNNTEITFKDLVSFLNEHGVQHELPDLLKCQGQIKEFNYGISLIITLQMDLEDLFQYSLSKVNLNEKERQLSQDFFKTHFYIFKKHYKNKINLKFKIINQSTFVKDSCQFDFSNIEEYFSGGLSFSDYQLQKAMKTYYMKSLIQQLKNKETIVNSNVNDSIKMSLLEHINHSKSCIENIWCFQKLLPIETHIQIIESETNIPLESIADINDFLRTIKLKNLYYKKPLIFNIMIII